MGTPRAGAGWGGVGVGAGAGVRLGHKGLPKLLEAAVEDGVGALFDNGWGEARRGLVAERAGEHVEGPQQTPSERRREQA